MTISQVMKYYEAQWGVPISSKTFRTPENEFTMLKWTPTQTSEGVFIFATLGACAVTGAPNHSCEYFFGLSTDPEGIFEALAEVALDGNGSGEIPDSGDTITLAMELWENTSLRSFLFTDGGEEILPPMCQGDQRIDFIQLVPLFPTEVAFRSRNGEAALWEHFKAHQTPYWDPARGAAI